MRGAWRSIRSLHRCGAGTFAAALAFTVAVSVLPRDSFSIGPAEDMDVSVKVESDGTLVGLPERYLPAKVALEFDAASGEPSSGKLSLGALQTALPPCLLRLFSVKRVRDLRAHASWYHDEAAYPHYIAFGVSRTRQVTFNLKTGKLIEIVDRESPAPRLNGMQSLALLSGCSSTELDSLTKP